MTLCGNILLLQKSKSDKPQAKETFQLSRPKYTNLVAFQIWASYFFVIN